MRIAFSYYQLKPVEGSRRPCRNGALLQVHFRDGKIGYCDCHPWPELGDASLEVQLELLACAHLTPLLTRSFAAARLDADARSSKRNLFASLPIPPSHHHLSDLLTMTEAEFKKCLEKPASKIKIKVGVAPQAEVAILRKWAAAVQSSGTLLRLDFNSRLNEDEFLTFFKDLEDEVQVCVEFYEDPFKYNPERWQMVRENYGIALACDHESLYGLDYPLSCDVLVVKPAVQEISHFLSVKRGNRKLVITSYLDHPIGQLAAAYTAASVFQQNKAILDTCGLLTHHAFEANLFSARLSQNDMCLQPSTEEYGWGYDTLLKEMPWKSLI